MEAAIDINKWDRLCSSGILFTKTRGRRSSDLALAYQLVAARHWPEVRTHADSGALADGVSALWEGQRAAGLELPRWEVLGACEHEVTDPGSRHRSSSRGGTQRHGESGSSPRRRAGGLRAERPCGSERGAGLGPSA